MVSMEIINNLRSNFVEISKKKVKNPFFKLK